jgi:hypothetical protein
MSALLQQRAAPMIWALLQQRHLGVAAANEQQIISEAQRDLELKTFHSKH